MLSKNNIFSLLVVSTFIGACGQESTEVVRSNDGAIHGTDDRESINLATDRYFQKVLHMRIHQSTERVSDYSVMNYFSQCTATLVAEDILLTAAHCVLSSLEKENDVIKLKKQIVFRVGYQNDGIEETFVDATVAVKIVMGNYIDNEMDPSHHTKDWALVKISRPIGKIYGYYDVLPTPFPREDYSKVPLSMVSFPGDRTQPQYQSGCFITNLYKGSYFTDCDTVGGSSGASLLKCDEQNRNCKVVAVNAGNITLSNARLGLVVNHTYMIRSDIFAPHLVKMKNENLFANTLSDVIVVED